jgi:hypothetical protein
MQTAAIKDIGGVNSGTLRRYGVRVGWRSVLAQRTGLTLRRQTSSERSLFVSLVDGVAAPDECRRFAKCLPMIVALYCMILPLRSAADSIILNCHFTAVLTGTNGDVQIYTVQRTIKAGSTVYRAWSSRHAEWGENECNIGRCTSNSTIFSFEMRDVNTHGGYVLENMEQLTIDRATGHMSAERKTSTTTSMTGYQAETTWYDDGTCVTGKDPTVSLKKGDPDTPLHGRRLAPRPASGCGRTTPFMHVGDSPESANCRP